MDNYYARKRQLGGGFTRVVPIASGDDAVVLFGVHQPAGPSFQTDQIDDVAVYTIHVQRLEIVIITGSAAKTWSVGAINALVPVDVTGAKSVATSNTRYTYDFGPNGVSIGEDTDLELAASAAGAVGYVVIEGYQSRRLVDPTIFDLSANTGTAAGGTSITVYVNPTEPGARVYFGTTEATVVSYDEENQAIAVTTPAHAAGLVAVSVQNPSRLRRIPERDGLGGFTFT